MKTLRKPENIKRAIFAIAILVVPSLIIYGISSSMRNRAETGAVGTIFGKTVDAEAFRRSFLLSRNYAAQIYGKDIPEEFVNELAWNRLILLAEANRQRIKVTDDEVIAKISESPQFQINGEFSPRLYKYVLGASARLFEDEMRNDIKIKRLRDRVTADIEIDDNELRTKYKARNEKASIDYIFVDPVDLAPSITTTESELIAYFDDHTEEFRTAPQVNVTYVKVNYKALMGEVMVTDEDIAEYYIDHKERYVITDATAITSEVIAETTETDEPAETDETTEADELTEADMLLPDEAIDDATDATPALMYKPLAEVAQDIRLKLIDTMSRELAFERMDEIYDRFLSEDPTAVATELGITFQETGFFSKEDPIPGIGLSYQVGAAAFKLKAPGELSDIIETPNACYLLMLKEKRLPAIPTFEEARHEVALSVTQVKARQKAREKASELLLQLTATMTGGMSFREAADTLNLNVQEAGPFTRGGYIPMIGFAPGFAEAVFELTEGAIASTPIETHLGSYIVKLTKLQTTTEADFLADKDSFRAEALERKKQAVYDAWAEELHQKADLVVFEEE